MQKGLFSIIVLNYNNFDYIYTMIDSIYNQTYEKIEIIIADDASDFFNKDLIDKYIKKFKRKINIKFIENKKNIGTVKIINKSLKYISGEYVLMTASDDSLFNSETISKYVNAFEESNARVVVSQWILCDNNLNIKEYFIPNSNFKKYNENLNQLLFDMCRSNRFGSGATAYKTSLFKNNTFDCSYKYLEDWPFWLKLIFQNEKIYFSNFNGLLHRGGGISENAKISSAKLTFFDELLKTFSNEIIPHLKKFNHYERYQILKSYKYNIEYYSKYIDTFKYEKDFYQLLIDNKTLRCLWIMHELNVHLLNKLHILLKCNKLVICTFFGTIITSIFMFKFIKNNQFKLLFLVLVYIIIYVTLIIYKEVRRRK